MSQILSAYRLTMLKLQNTKLIRSHVKHVSLLPLDIFFLFDAKKELKQNI